MQSVFAKDTAFLSAKAQKLQNSAFAEFWDCTPVFAFETGIFFRGFGLGLLVRQGFLGAKAGFVGFGLGLLVSSGFFNAKAGFVEGCNLWNVLYNPETYVW